jgi:hypothetical protein
VIGTQHIIFKLFYFLHVLKLIVIFHCLTL